MSQVLPDKLLRIKNRKISYLLLLILFLLLVITASSTDVFAFQNIGSFSSNIFQSDNNATILENKTYLPFIFSPDYIPGIFNKYLPSNGSVGVSITPILSWTKSNNVTEYEYCIDIINDGACSNWISTGTNNYVGLNGLNQSTKYYWQVRSWNGSYGPTYANGAIDQFWSFKTIQPRLVVFEGFLRPICSNCRNAATVIDQLATEYSDSPVLFLEYNVDWSNMRESRWWDSYHATYSKEDSVVLPMAMVDSGDQISFGYLDFHTVYSDMIETSLPRPPKADISANWQRAGNTVEATIDVTNISNINFSYQNSAKLFLIVYEKAKIGLTNRYVRSVASTDIEDLPPGQSAQFTLITEDLDVNDWNNIEVVVIADYASFFDPERYLRKFDTIQAVIADTLMQ